MLARMRAMITAVAIGCLLPALGGCQVSFGGSGTTRSATTTPSEAAGPSIPKRDVEQVTAQLIREKSGGGPYVITCPNDLPIKMGASMQCVVADQDHVHHELTVTITKADSPNNATWDWEVGKEISSS